MHAASVASSTWQRGKVNKSDSRKRPRTDHYALVFPDFHHGITAMIIQISFLVLLAQLAITQQASDKDGSHGAVSQTGSRTRFSCVGRVAGYYADIESDCQLYHMCDGEGRRFTHSCPNATLFHQRMMICDHWYMVNCSGSEQDYNANLLIGQRNTPFVSNEEHVHRRDPVKFLTVLHNPGTLQQPNWFPVATDRKDSDNTVLNADHPVTVGYSTHQRGSPETNTHRQARYKPIRYEDSSISPLQGTTDRTASLNYAQSTNIAQSLQVRPQVVLPDIYTNNPFLQLLTARAPTVPTYVDVSNNKTPDISKLKQIANVKVAVPKAEYYQQPSRGAKQDVRAPKHSDTYTNNPFLASLIKTTPHSTVAEDTSNVVEDDLNTLELHLLDYRRMFFIPETNISNNDLQAGNSTTLLISLPALSKPSHSLGGMRFRNNVRQVSGRNPICPQCHPNFLVPGKCEPCVIIR